MDHKDLEVWKKSMNLVESVYAFTSNFPSEERYGLLSQIRRAAVSVPSNVVEGAARKGDKELVQFLMIALGSLAELETQYLLSSIRLKFGVVNKELEDFMIAVKKLFLGFGNYILNK
ncbi:four helix bundle protein [Cognatitamlana onchidii]|uniref:four helix bundle protein n=1 Tax=Cognatitamlana onchidii TaxID=2562860 RepID=UPI0010A6267D|nr:four helix bundle protein [Algibacter onchidii]